MEIRCGFPLALKQEEFVDFPLFTVIDLASAPCPVKSFIQGAGS